MEDESIDQEVSHDFLEEFGLVVDLADDGFVTVDMEKRTKFSLILMDMQMPLMKIAASLFPPA